MQTRFDKQERLYQIVRLIRPIQLNAARTFEALLKGSALSLSGRAVLELLVERGAMTVPEAARALSMKRQFVQRIVAGLAAHGHVERVADPRAGRARLFAASQDGRHLFAELHRHELDLLRSHLGDINTTEAIVTLRVMQRLSACFDRLGRDAGEAGAADAPAARRA